MKTDSTGQPLPFRRISRRTCVACREVKPKRQLIRLVYGVDGTVDIDPSGKKAGRGAYLCCSSDCWEKGLKKSKLEYALRGRVNAESWTGLLESGKRLCSDNKGNDSG